MDFRTAEALKKVNDIKRLQIKKKMDVFQTDFEKIEYLVKKFLKEYEFDYSSLTSAYDLSFQRNYKEKEFVYEGKRYFSKSVMNVKDRVASGESELESENVDYKNPVLVYHSVHALNMGTCASFSAELDWFAKEFCIESKIEVGYEYCYDGYEDVDEKDELKCMQHFYNVMNLDGEEYKIDVAGAIMAIDYVKKHQDAKVCPKDFVFVNKDSQNPFNEIFKEINVEPNV